MSGSSGKSKQSSHTTENVTNSPLAAEAPYYNQLWQSASSNLAHPSAQQTADATASGAAYRGAAGDLTGYSHILGGFGADLAGGKYLGPNEYLNPAIDAATRDTWNTFNQETLPALAAYGNASGAYGGARNSLAAGEAGGRAFQAADDIASKLAYSNYEAERDRQMQAPQVLAAAGQLGVGAGDALQSAATSGTDPQTKQLLALAQILQAGGFGTKSGTQDSTGKVNQSGFAFSL